MKNIFHTLSFFIAFFNCSIAAAQQDAALQNDLQGEMELSIDVSNMKDTAGRFMVMVGGALFYPGIKNNTIIVNKSMPEPRRAVLSFFSEQKIKENPGKPLNEIAVEIADNLDFLAVPGKYKIVVKGTVANGEIRNALPHQEKYFELLKLKSKFDQKMEKEQALLLTDLKNAKNNRLKDSLISVYYKYAQDQYPKYYQDTIMGFVKDNPDAPASLYELELYSHDRNKDLKMMNFLFNNLTNRIKALPTGRRVFGTIDAEDFAAYNMVGKLAPNFTQNDPLGKAVSLKDFKGNVILLEFWASWCGPCRESNPALLNTYQKYSNKGFKILGVSLDDHKERWLKAIADDGLVWTQVSDLQFFKNEVATQYHISYIPSNFLIDQSGIVLASNLDEKQLNQYLEKLLK